MEQLKRGMICAIATYLIREDFLKKEHAKNFCRSLQHSSMKHTKWIGKEVVKRSAVNYYEITLSDSVVKSYMMSIIKNYKYGTWERSLAHDVISKAFLMQNMFVMGESKKIDRKIMTIYSVGAIKSVKIDEVPFKHVYRLIESHSKEHKQVTAL